MLIRDIGEFGLIKRFRRQIKTSARVIKGSGDDCAVLAGDKKHYRLFTCDMLVEGVDFYPGEDPYLAGRKAIAVSVSDIAACCGMPRHCLIALGIPDGTRVKFIDGLFRGMLGVCRKYKIDICGGDISRAPKLVIDVSMLGEVEKDYLTLRSGAGPGDIIFVTGSLGGSIKGKHLRFTPRVDQARLLRRNFKISSMIDISDGLCQDLGHIIDESKAGAVIYENLIPVSPSARNLSDALYAGEDFELLFTLPLKEAKRFTGKWLKVASPIGEIRKRKYGLKLVDKNNRERVIRPKGFRHF